jgi:hypothetical protein
MDHMDIVAVYLEATEKKNILNFQMQNKRKIAGHGTINHN